MRPARTYCFIDDCVEGILRLMRSDYSEPLNLGQARIAGVDEIVEMVATIAAKRIRAGHDPSKPQGVLDRNSDNSKPCAVFGSEPEVGLEEWLRRNYEWMASQAR